MVYLYYIQYTYRYIYDMLKHIFDFENNTFVIDFSLIAEEKNLTNFKAGLFFSKVIPISTLHKVHTYSSRSTTK